MNSPNDSGFVPGAKSDDSDDHFPHKSHRWDSKAVWHLGKADVKGLDFD